MLDLKRAIPSLLILIVLQLIVMIILFSMNLIFLAIISIILLILSTYWIIKFGVMAATGDFFENVDISGVEIQNVSIPAEVDGKKGFLYGVIYRDKKDEVYKKKPYIIAAHGARNTYKHVEWFSIPLALNGFNVIAFNQSGCGEGSKISIGDSSSYVHAMQNVHDVVDFVKKQDDLEFDGEENPKIGFIGHSTGGIMALSQAYVNSDIKVTISMAGVHDFMELANKKFKIFTPEWFFKLGLKLGHMKIKYTEEENFYISPKYCLQFVPENEKRVFIIHSEDDVLPIDGAYMNQRLAGISDYNCLYLSKGGHDFRCQETIVISKVINWFKENL